MNEFKKQEDIQKIQLELKPPNNHKPFLVVRIWDSKFCDSSGVFHYDRRMRVLKSKSSGIDFLKIEWESLGSEMFDMITNFNEVEEGVYYIYTKSFTDWESGMVDDYEYTLIPFDKEG